jgi:hypothetical protein
VVHIGDATDLDELRAGVILLNMAGRSLEILNGTNSAKICKCGFVVNGLNFFDHPYFHFEGLSIKEPGDYRFRVNIIREYCWGGVAESGLTESMTFRVKPLDLIGRSVIVYQRIHEV